MNHMMFEGEEKEDRLEQFVFGWEPKTEEGEQLARAKYTRQTQGVESREENRKERSI